MVLFGFTLASLVLWAMLLTAVALIPLGVGLPLTAVTLRAMGVARVTASFYVDTVRASLLGTGSPGGASSPETSYQRTRPRRPRRR
jgi:hypothetical protein